jgi:hypothetical protein
MAAAEAPVLKGNSLLALWITGWTNEETMWSDVMQTRYTKSLGRVKLAGCWLDAGWMLAGCGLERMH